MLTSDTTNITSADSWTVPSDFEMWTEEDQRVAQDNNVAVQVWNLASNKGEIINVNPANYTRCTNGIDNVYYPDILECEIYRLVTDEMTPMDTISTNTASSIEGNKYDAHYLIGNYYSWNAATAGSGGARVAAISDEGNIINTNEAPDSVCPAGWQLPIGGTINDNPIRNLLSKYGLQSNAINEITGANVSFYPLYFVRGGAVNPYSRYAWHLGSSGFYWLSSPATDIQYSYRFYFNVSDLTLPDISGRANGLSVRCLAASQ